MTRAELFEAHAQRCRSCAETASGEDARQLFAEMAAHWDHLASLASSLEIRATIPPDLLPDS
jgi:hypothetical protein